MRLYKYGLMKRFHRGIKVSVNPSWKCNLRCPYCILQTTGKNKFPVDSQPIKSLEYWKEYVDTFPVKIREVALAGGEPSLLPYFVPLVDYLLSKGYFVLVFTNLTNQNLLNVKPHRRLRIEATHHPCYDINKFDRNYQAVSKIHRVDVVEIMKKELPYSRKIPWSSEDQAKTIDKNYLKVGPDGTIYRSCFDRNEAFK